MKNINHYITEAFSANQEKELLAFVNDKEFDEVMSLLRQHFSKKSIDEEKFKKFFEKHDLTRLNWGPKNSAVKQFVNCFAENGHLDVLKQIIDDDCVIDDIAKMEETGNIFAYCNTRGIDWTEEAKTIALWTPKGSANSGNFEVLLKFMLKETTYGKTGDITLNSNEEFEVKAWTIGGSGAHASGQKGKIHNASAVYQYLNKHLFHEDDSLKYAESCIYFQKEAGINIFNEKCVASKCTPEQIGRELAMALAYQYGFVDDIDDEKTNLPKAYVPNFIAVIKSIYNNGFKINSLSDAIGVAQLYLYSQVEKFKYFICLAIDKNIQSTSPKNGYYILYRDCDTSQSPLINFADTMTKFKFGRLESTTTSQGRTGKMEPKI